MAGDLDRAATLLRAALRGDAPPAGRVQFIDARGPVDLLTLRAARALAAADVLVCDPAAHAEVLALARRDAERLAPLPAKDLADLAGQGRRVARLIVEAGWRQEEALLTAAGVDTEILPIAS
jgi:precorrin-2 dehydrogenase/sirohydrochlorin ferrochelatase